MLRIGLTGGIGSGKSTTAAAFEALGVPVINADRIVHELTLPGMAAVQKIRDAFGDDVITPQGQPNRRELSKRIFGRASERRKLESILHPLVRAEIEKQLQLLSAPYCVVEIPLLIETGQLDLIDRVLVVEASESVRIRRVRERDGRSEAEIVSILASQASDDERRDVAHDVLHNNGSLEDLHHQVRDLHAKYLALVKHPTTARSRQ